MKSTGVVRRIDELGRIVIPKEIRKNFRIKEGENLEIFIGDNEIISLKKYSILDKFSELSNIIIYTLKQMTNQEIVITDTTSIVGSSNTKEKMINKSLSNDFIDLISERKKIIDNKLVITSEVVEKYFIIIPLIVNSDLIGSIFLMSNDPINKKDEMLVEFASKILINYVEQ